MLGVLFGLLSAASFGLTGATIRRGVIGASALQGLYVTIFTALPMFALVTLLAGEIAKWDAFGGRDYVFLGLGGISQLLVGRYSNYRAIAALGANRSSPVVGSSTLVAIAIAVVFIGERVTVVMGLGIALMMIGPGLVAPRRRRPAPVGGASGTGPAGADAPAEGLERSVVTHPRYAEGYFFGGLTALAWGVGPVFIRSAVEDNGLGLLAGFITYIAAAGVLLVVLMLPGQISSLVHMDRTGGSWFLFTSLNSYLANLFRVAGLAAAPVAVIMPMVRLSSVFTLLFNLIMNRSLESFEPRVVAGILVSVAGAVFLVVGRPA